MTPLSVVQLNARALAGPPVTVPLAALYNVSGITTSGTPYFTGGYDGSSWAFSSELLGSSVTWNGVVFPLGPVDKPDAVANAIVAVPAGSFASLLLIGSSVNNVSPATGHFVLHYTDGTSTAIDQDMSDWVNPRNYTGESIATCTPTRNNYDGTIDLNSVCIYGYALAVDPARTLASVTLPTSRDMVFLSMVALPASVPGTYSYTPAAGTVSFPGTSALAVSFAPASATYVAASGTNSLTVLPPKPPITPTLLWPVPASVLPGDRLSAVQLDASAVAPLNPVPVALPYRINAFYPDGTQYEERGFDGNQYAFSSTLLGTALHYAGFTFPLGRPSVPDAATSSTVELPSGSFSTLYLLGAGANGAQMAQPFTVTYSDGATATTLLNLSSWTSPQSFAGETLVASTAYADTSTGQQSAGSYSLYGYQIPLDSTRVPKSLTLPSNTDVVMLAAGLGTGATIPVAGSLVYTPAAGTTIESFTTLSTSFTPADNVDFAPAQASVPLVVGALDFTLTAVDGNTFSATFGQSPSLAFAVAPTNNIYAGPLSFSLEGTLPPLASYTITPGSLAANAGPTTLRVSVQTRRLSGQLAGQTTILFCGVVLLAGSRRKRRVLLPLLLLLPVGCGTGYHTTSYAVTLVATDGHFRHTLPLTLRMEASPQ